MSLLNEIENAAIDSSVPLADLLRKCKVLAARLKHQEFAAWISKELNGYGDDDELPPYRQLGRGPSFGHFSGPFGSGLKNAPIPTGLLPNDLRKIVTEHEVRDPVSTLEAMAAGGEGKLVWKWPADLIALVQHKHPFYMDMALMDAWANFPAGQLKGVIDTVRTRVLDFVLAIQAENPDAGEAKPNAPPPVPMQTVTQHFHTTIIGGQANVGNTGPSSIGDSNVASVGNSQTMGLQDSTVQQLLAELRGYTNQLGEDDREEAVDAIQKVETQLAKPQPDLERIKQYLALYGTIVSVASPTIEKFIQYLGPLLIK